MCIALGGSNGMLIYLYNSIYSIHACVNLSIGTG